MAGGYPFLNKVKDPATFQALKAAWDQILASQAALARLAAIAVTVGSGESLNARGQRVINVATPTAAADAVPLNYLYNIVNSLQHNNLQALQGGQHTNEGGEFYHLTAEEYGVLAALAAPSSGSQTQATSKATAVTLDAQVGDITMDAANLAADTVVSFTLNNSFITAGSVLVINHVSAGTLGAYIVTYTPAGGSATIYLTNISTGALAEAIVLRFLVLPGA